MWRRLLITGLVLATVAIIWAVDILPAYLAGRHHHDVTRSLAEWKTEYSDISSHHDAVRAAEMLRYVQGYFVVSDGYRSTTEIESELESQRQDTVDSLVVALRSYTKQDFGTDSAKWLAYLKTVKPADKPSPKK